MRIVVALGGNFVGKNNQEDLKIVKNAAKEIVKMASNGHEIIVVHGNGDQDNILVAKDSQTISFAENKAMSQGYIGYHLQNAIKDELKRKKINKECLTIISEVEVDQNDKSLNNPTVPIGIIYEKDEAKKLEREKKYTFIETKKGYQRLVPSPKPIDILEISSIEELVKKGNIVITCGGGGIPVIKKGKKYIGIDAIINKDDTASEIASQLDADILLMLTTVSNVFINYKTKNEKKLTIMDLDETYKYIDENQFSEKNMLPKIKACCNYIENFENGTAIIADIKDAEKALNGKKGTKIVKKIGEKKKKNKKIPSAFTILTVAIVILGAITHLLPEASFVNGEIINGSGVVRATLSQILMSPLLGFSDAMSICLFLMILGAFLKVVMKTGALETGIQVLIKKLKGKELLLIPIIMFIFSIGGTTYGMQAETVGFYALLSATMVAAGMDTVVASATVLLGAGVGVIGSTVNPFAVGAAIEALPEGITANRGIIIAIGIVLWIASYIISVLFVMKYAKKVKNDKGSTILSLQEQKLMHKKYGKTELPDDIKLTSKQKLTLWIFGIAFLIMVLGFIPWSDFGITLFDNLPHKIIGTSIGNWRFNEASLWFLLITILICIVNKFSEKETVDTFVDGADDMVGVILIVAIARGVSVLMKQTYLDNYLIYTATDLLRGLPIYLYTIINYILHVLLSILVPSSSGLASLSTPIIASLATEFNYSIEANIMIIVAANGLVNLITPTCGAIMGGLALAKVDYQTWFKWSWKLILYLMLMSIIVLTIAMIVF